MTWQEAVVGAVTITMIGLVIAVVVSSVMRVGQTAVAKEGSTKSEQRIQAIATESTRTQQTTADELAELRILLTGMNQRLASIETMMKEVG